MADGQGRPPVVGKPNPLMMRSALNALDAHSKTAAMIGDRMDTDIVSGREAEMHTILVLTGLTSREEAERYPYRPSQIVLLGRWPDRELQLASCGGRTLVHRRLPGRSPKDPSR